MKIDSQYRLIAILRGITPKETTDIVSALLDAGVRAFEITMNSPEPLSSIEIACKVVRDRGLDGCLVGAGTVLNVKTVRAVHALGGNLIVSPNVNAEVIQKTRDLNMQVFPGVFTATEAFAAIEAGASCLKFFPASQLGPEGIAAMKAVLPPEMRVYAVGGASPHNFKDFLNAGAYGFGIGSNIYKQGTSALEIGTRARALLDSFPFDH